MTSLSEVNPTHARLLSQFAYQHLPPELQALSQPFADTTVALRKLLEAKDAYVRAAVS